MRILGAPMPLAFSSSNWTQVGSGFPDCAVVCRVQTVNLEPASITAQSAFVFTIVIIISEYVSPPILWVANWPVAGPCGIASVANVLVYNKNVAETCIATRRHVGFDYAKVDVVICIEGSSHAEILRMADFICRCGDGMF